MSAAATVNGSGPAPQNIDARPADSEPGAPKSSVAGVRAVHDFADEQTEAEKRTLAGTRKILIKDMTSGTEGVSHGRVQASRRRGYGVSVYGADRPLCWENVPSSELVGANPMM